MKKKILHIRKSISSHKAQWHRTGNCLLLVCCLRPANMNIYHTLSQKPLWTCILNYIHSIQSIFRLLFRKIEFFVCFNVIYLKLEIVHFLGVYTSKRTIFRKSSLPLFPPFVCRGGYFSRYLSVEPAHFISLELLNAATSTSMGDVQRCSARQENRIR